LTTDPGKNERRQPMTRLETLVLGTRNVKKRAELQELLAPHGFRLETLDDYPQSVEVEETGTTFAENAALKATQQALALQQWVLGEDSGLCVDALDGRPGVFSARFAGPQATDQQNNQKLLEQLQGVPDPRRGAKYVCHMALADPRGELRISCQGSCRGRIAQAPAGEHGFGYDPLFYLPEYHRTFGQLGPAAKAALSHRSRANQRFVPLLLQLARSQQSP
jgi:XTP/dITP diphosphohydrolase